MMRQEHQAGMAASAHRPSPTGDMHLPQPLPASPGRILFQHYYTAQDERLILMLHVFRQERHVDKLKPLR